MEAEKACEKNSLKIKNQKKRSEKDNIVFLILLGAIVFSAISLIFLHRWELPFLQHFNNPFWQMGINVFLGTLLTTTITLLVFRHEFSANKKEESERQNRLHRQEIAKENKVELFQQIIEFASAADYKEESIEDIKTIDAYVYKLKLLAGSEVLQAAIKMFDKVTLSASGENKQVILDFAKACNSDLYFYENRGLDDDDAGNLDLCGTLFKIQTRVAGLISGNIHWLYFKNDNVKGENQVPRQQEIRIKWHKIRTANNVTFSAAKNEEGQLLVDTSENQLVVDGLFKDGDMLVFVHSQKRWGIPEPEESIIGLATFTKGGSLRWGGTVTIEEGARIDAYKALRDKPVQTFTCGRLTENMRIYEDVLMVLERFTEITRKAYHRLAKQRLNCEFPYLTKYLSVKSERSSIENYVAKCKQRFPYVLQVRFNEIDRIVEVKSEIISSKGKEPLLVLYPIQEDAVASIIADYTERNQSADTLHKGTLSIKNDAESPGKGNGQDWLERLMKKRVTTLEVEFDKSGT